MPLLAAIDRVRGELQLRHGREPSEDEVAAALRIKPEELRAFTAVGRPLLSLDEAFAGDKEHAWVQVLSDSGAPGPGENADQTLLRERVDEVLRALAPRDREVIELRFGLKDGRVHTLDEVARALGVTRERVRQIEARGLERLQQRRERLVAFTELN